MSHARITIACACTMFLLGSFLAFGSTRNEEENEVNEQTIHVICTCKCEETTESNSEENNKTNNINNTETTIEETDTSKEVEESIEETIESIEEETTEQIETMSVVQEIEPEYISKYVPSNNSFKSYMSYKAITMKSSPQYKLQQTAYTDMYGLRMVNGRYCIALGTYYTSTIGAKVDVVMANGSILKCIVGDIKANKDTDSQNIKAQDGSVVEFIIDSSALHPMARRMGNISYAAEKFSGEITEIRVYQN